MNVNTSIEKFKTDITINCNEMDGCGNEGNRGSMSPSNFRAEPLHFFGNMSFSLDPIFRKQVEKISHQYRTKTGKILRYHIPFPGDSMEIIDHRLTEIIDNLPDVITSIGFENIFQPDFIERFTAGGHLCAVPVNAVHPAFKAAGFIDPDGRYTIHAVTPYVFLVDRPKLGNLKPPETWEDILHPRYKNNVICNGSRSHFSYILLFYIFRLAGLDGVRRLARNIHDALHAALIARIAGRPTSVAAIYILPWFFARICPWTDNTTVIWPSDGAIVSPMWLQAKKSRSTESDIFINLITGTEFGAKAAEMFAPVANAQVDNRLPAAATFRWLGWDFIRKYNPMKLKGELLEIFMEQWRQSAAQG